MPSLGKPRHGCEVVLADFIWGPMRCGISTRRRMKDENGEKHWVCKSHREQSKGNRFSNKEGRNR